jgi:DnaK suppressor protein
MRKAFLKSAREKLLQMRREVLREMNDDLRQGREGHKEEGMDAYDLASEERDREINFILTDREREKVQSIQEALERIDEGTYGICESCEAEIAEGRLSALPFTRMCVACQAEHEKEMKASRRFEDERAYRRLGSADVEEENS